MTRSVEIPEAAVEAAGIAFWEHPASHGMNSKARQRAIRAALEAALPYLAPAGEQPWEMHHHIRAVRDAGYIVTVPGTVLAAPQPVDREALAKRIERAIDASQLMGCGCCGGLYDYNKYESASEALAAQLADLVLAGEQEQVVPE